ncbi:MAG: hypothetical protein ACTHU0_22455 [Kofleriaceae bacterium]
MFRDDYLHRMIEQLAAALRRLIRARERADHAEALEIAGGLYDELLGMPRALVDRLDVATLVASLRNPDKVRLAATLAREEAHTYAAMGEPAAALRRYRRAHELRVAARAMSPSPEDDAELEELARRIDATARAPAP